MRQSKPLNPDRELQAYIAGIAVGDGNLSNPNGRATRLRITCDTKYPLLLNKIRTSLQKLFPRNKVSIVKRKEAYLDISVYSNHLEKIVGWRANHGSKVVQKVSVPKWIIRRKKYVLKFLCGLFETDGSIYKDRGYTMANLTTAIPSLASDVQNLCIRLGFSPKLYRVKNKYSEYHLRVSKDTEKFIKTLEILKA